MEAHSFYRLVASPRNDGLDGVLAEPPGGEQPRRPDGGAAAGHDRGGALRLRRELGQGTLDRLGGDPPLLEVVADQRVAAAPLR